MEQTANNLNTRMMNPMIRKLYKVTDQAPDRPATYAGITAKTIFFIVLLVVGGGLFFFLRPYLAVGEPITLTDYNVDIYFPEGCVAILALIFAAVSPFLAFLIKPLTPIFGTIYCCAMGYTFTWFATILSNDFGGLIYAAAIITALLVLVMTLLYATGVVKVTSKFRGVVTTLFFTCALSGVAGFVLSFVPGVKDIIATLQNNFIITIIGGVVYIVIACLFLLVDFEAIRHTVEAEQPKKYEWIAAFGLVYTVIYLFMKVLALLTKLSGKNNSTTTTGTL